MTMQPRDIVVWSHCRSGSTNMCLRLVYGLRWFAFGLIGSDPSQPAARYLGEGTGQAGTMGTSWRGMGGEISRYLEDRMHTGGQSIGQVSVPYYTWHLNQQGHLSKRPAHGDPWDEIQNRMRIIRDGDWTHPIVFKHMGWPVSKELQQQATDCVLQSRKELYHVCTWRVNLFDWMCSHYFLRKRFDLARVGHNKNFGPHGIFEWNGEPFRFIKPQFKKNFMASSARLLDNFCALIRHMPRDKSIMVALEDTNRLDHISWPNGGELSIPSNQLLEQEFPDSKTGKNVYLYQGRRIRAADMIDPELLETFREWSQIQERRLDWKNLPAQMGIKTQPG